jgi:hypothetical protein
MGTKRMCGDALNIEQPLAVLDGVKIGNQSLGDVLLGPVTTSLSNISSITVWKSRL